MTIGSRLGRTLLAQLAVSPGRSVSVDALVDGLWPEALPQRPVAALQIQVTRLRKHFSGAVVPLVSTRGGYVLRLEDDEVDLVRFERAVQAALSASDDDVIISQAGRALALWAEPFLGCRPGERLETVRVRTRERFLRVLERYADTLLSRDGPNDAASAADTLLPHVPAHRDRESLVALAMRCLHRLDRTVEALAVYAETRHALRVEHGVDPGPALRNLEQGLLASPARRGVRVDPVVGREDLLAAIRSRLDDPERGWVVLVSGEAGIGKTWLLWAARAEAHLRGAATGAGVWDEIGTPLAAWVEGLRGLGTAPPAVGDPEPGRSVRRALASRADGAPLVLTLDDAHRADSASRGVLLAVARLGLPPGVVVLVAAREPDALAHPQWEDTHATLVRHEGVASLTVGGLDEVGVAALLETRPTSGPHDAADLWSRSAGHPLHLVALLDVTGSGELVVPDRLRPLLAHQLSRLSDDCREVLEALAVLAPIGVDALAAVLETSTRRVVSALRPAADLGLVVPRGDGYVLRHELTALVARERLPAPHRALLHRARLERLPHDVDPFERLRHVLGAADLLAPPVVSAARLSAARTARARGALTEALTLLDDSTVPEVAVLRGLVLEALGRADEADAVLDAVVSDPTIPPTLRADAAVGVDALGISIAGRARKLARLQQVRDLPVDDVRRANVLRALINEQQQLLGDAEADALPDLLALVRRRPDDSRLQAQVALLRVNQVADEPVPVLDRLRLAERARVLAADSGEDELLLEAEEMLVAALLAAGRQDEADVQRERLALLADRHRHARALWAGLLLEASLQLARGEADEALTTADAARERGQELGLADFLGAYGVHLAAHHLLAGSLPTLGGLPALAAEHYPHVAAWAAVAAVDATQAGDAGRAADHLAEFHRRRHGRPHRLFDRPGLCLASAAALAIGDPTTAQVVLKDLPPDPGAVVVVGVGAAVLGPLDTFRGMALLTLDRIDEARDALRAAGDVATRLGWRPWADAATVLARHVDGATALPFGLSRV